MSARPPPPPPPPSCDDVLCTDNSLSGSNLLTSLYIDILLGVLCYFGFVLWRGVFPVYHGREFLPGVRRRPPKLKLGGHWQLWCAPPARRCAQTMERPATAPHPEPPTAPPARRSVVAGRGSSPPGTSATPTSCGPRGLTPWCVPACWPMASPSLCRSSSWAWESVSATGAVLVVGGREAPAAGLCAGRVRR